MRNPAAFRTRILAKLIDVLVLSLVGGGVVYFFAGRLNLDWAGAIGWDFFYMFYLILLPPMWSGYIIGKRICNIRLKKYEGDRHVTISDTFMREAVGFHMIGILTLGVSVVVSLFMIAFRKDRRSLHDIVGGTYVSSQ